MFLVTLCECGCGEPVKYRRDGSPNRFLKGHHLRNEGAPLFRGDAVGYRALHTYLSKHYPKAGVCDECNKQARTDYALIKGKTYSRNRDDYRELCRSCHIGYDEIGRYLRQNEIMRQAAGDPPSCKCGCGTIVGWDRSRSRWLKYAPGHYSGNAKTKHLAGYNEARHLAADSS